MDEPTGGTLAADAESVGALADPVRLALYRFVCAQSEPVSRDQAAEGVGIPRHRARFHLDRLASDGLLQTSHARLTGRSGPGAGRPATLYRRAAREISISLPDREYGLAARLLGDAVVESARSGAPVIDAVNGAFAAYGDAAGRAAGDPEADGDVLGTAVRVLASHGYEPRRTEDHVDLHNCPFHALAQVHTELVCGANRCLVGALADRIAPDQLDVRLEPQPDRCCVVLDARR
ncbi:helix-turn-helix transcriptional regulator [Cellulomonas sp.]|uniref:helix-turn-helix transcriptional regulator n=1 Tax=Cellulomonas sp. TaxID=40001 RepID=UPI003BAD4EC1